MDNKKEPTPLKDYWNRLAGHDWYYEYIERPYSKWKAGFDEQGALRRIADESPDHKALYDAFYDYKWKGGAQPPKPE